MILVFICFILGDDWAAVLPPPPPPTAPRIVHSTYSYVEIEFYLFYGGKRRGGCVRGPVYSYCRSQLICPPPSPFSHYSQLLPLTVGVSPPSHFPLKF